MRERKGPYRAPNSHCITAGVHCHDLGLVVKVVEAEALLLVLQEHHLQDMGSWSGHSPGGPVACGCGQQLLLPSSAKWVSYRPSCSVSQQKVCGHHQTRVLEESPEVLWLSRHST